MGHFQDERDRLRAKMRQDFPTIAAAVDACRARRCAVEVLHASEGGNERGRASAFVEAWAEAGEQVELHRLFAQAQRDEVRRFSRAGRGTI